MLNAHADNELREKEFLKNTISDISHQLKTPLAALNIYNGLLQDEDIEVSSVKEFAGLSEQELDRIETLVQSLLKITRLDAGAIVLEKNAENVADMMRDIELHFAYRARQEKKEIILSGSDHLSLFCDRDWLNLQCLKKDSALKRGSDLSKVFRDSNFVLATSDQDSTWKIGDTVQIGDETLTIAGLLKNDPFSENGLTNGKLTLITSDETFVRLTGEEGYSLVLIQTTGDVTDENVQAIQNSVDQTYSFQDKRDERTTGTYMAFVFCVYAFLAIIALVTVMNIVNSISMSVSARMKQYGAMRAVGMDERQMTKMIACEAFTYAVLGCVVGCAIGLPLSKSLYDFLIAGHFPSAVWQFPIISLGVILLFVSIAAIAAVYAPAKRIRNMSITATINEL